MSEKKQNTEPEFQAEEMPKRTKKKRFHFRRVLDGSILDNEFVAKNIGYFIFLAALTMVYIANNFHTEKLVREESHLKNISKELRAKQISKSFELMKSIQQSQVISKINESGLELKEATQPPYILKVTNE
ncbi:MAG: hypothetical protein J7L46_07220 [Bacteroidales bacterium]|nr:hypothetical protein [Bacteroidales bacterium]